MPFRISTKCESCRGKVDFALAATLALLAAGGCSKAQPTSVLGDAAHPAPVHFYTVAEETARRRIQAVGSLYALEESTLSSEVEGRVAEVLADIGDNVREGQPLVRIDPEELQFEVERQRGIVRQVRAQLGIGPDDPPPSDPKKIASVQRAEADLFDADQKYTRAQQMFRDNLISQQQLDEAASRYQSTKATYTVALQEVDRLKALLVSSEASERLAEKKLNDSTIRVPYPGSIKTRVPQGAKSGYGPCAHGPFARALGRAGALGGMGKGRRHHRSARGSVSGRNLPRKDFAHQSRSGAGLSDPRG